MATEQPDTGTPTETVNGYERTVSALRVVKLVLGLVVSALTALHLVGVI